MFFLEGSGYNSSGRQQACPEHGCHPVKLKASFLRRPFPPCELCASNIIRRTVTSDFKSLQTQPWASFKSKAHSPVTSGISLLPQRRKIPPDPASGSRDLPPPPHLWGAASLSRGISASSASQTSSTHPSTPSPTLYHALPRLRDWDSLSLLGDQLGCGSAAPLLLNQSGIPSSTYPGICWMSSDACGRAFLLTQLCYRGSSHHPLKGVKSLQFSCSLKG